MDNSATARPLKRLRVALAIPHLGGGGAERSTIALARGLISRGFSVDLLLFYESIAFKNEIPTEARIHVFRHQQSMSLVDFYAVARRLGPLSSLLLRRRHFRHALSLADYLDRERPDFLLPSLAEPKIASFIATIFTNFRPTIVPVVRNNVMNRSWRSRALYRRLFDYSDHIVAVSSGVAESLSAHVGVSANRLTTIYNPVVTDDIIRGFNEAPNHPWFADSGPPVILAAGRLSRVKDFPTLIRAFEIASRHRPLRLLILGEGSWRPRLEKMVHKKGLTDIVSLPGWVENPFAYMRRAAVFVLSSKYEGLSGVLIQALACGCPCVSTDCPSGSREILDGGRVGPLVPVADPSALAAAIEEVLDHPPDISVLTARASQFSYEESISQYVTLLHRLGEKSKQRG